MEKRSEITYTLTKRKFSDDSSEGVSSESMLESLSTSISSQGSFMSSHFEDKSLEPLSLIPPFPLNKTFSRSLQQQISKASAEKLKKLLKSIHPVMSELMVDLYGNYICQTIFHSCSAEQRLELLQSMKGHLVRISKSPRGTHALQNLISLASLKEEEKFYVEEFKGKLIDMSKDINASHVVQKLLGVLDSNFFFVKEVKGRVKDLATDKFGVCVLKKCVKNPEITSEIIENALFLMQHPFGNYSVQYIIESWGDEISFELFSCISGRITQLCLQKFASNVIEKAVKLETLRGFIIKEIFTKVKFEELLQNQYGCFVLRTFSSFCEVSIKADLISTAENIFHHSSYPKLRPLWREILTGLSGTSP
jgi:hypothetical protein